MANGVTETEIVFYCKVGEPEGLLKADHIETHEQLECRLLNGNKIRVRKTTQPGNEVAEYVFTTKKKSKSQDKDGTPNVQEATEFNTTVDEKFMDVFGEIMEQQIKKVRYTFKNRAITIRIAGVDTPLIFDDVKYEVDLFTTSGQPSEYVKVDIEVDALLAFIKDKYPDLMNIPLKFKPGWLPFKPYDIIFPGDPNLSQDKRDVISNLWKTSFSRQVNPAEEKT